MRQNRRSFLLALMATPVALSLHPPLAMAQRAKTRRITDFPDPATFRSGDFVWPKKKNAIVPRMEVPAPPSEERAAWEAARDRLLQQENLPQEVAGRLKNMSYEEFASLYFSGPAPSVEKSGEGRSLSIGGQNIYVGHVGIIQIDGSGVPHVVEATGRTVARTVYADWLKGHSDMQVWHGRVRDLSAGVRARIAAEASKQIGKPYAFFNFDLSDDSGFYCSKLAWMSVWRATSGTGQSAVAMDDNPNPRRAFFSWFTPKQLINAKRVRLLHKPDEF